MRDLPDRMARVEATERQRAQQQERCRDGLLRRDERCQADRHAGMTGEERARTTTKHRPDRGASTMTPPTTPPRRWRRRSTNYRRRRSSTPVPSGAPTRTLRPSRHGPWSSRPSPPTSRPRSPGGWRRRRGSRRRSSATTTTPTGAGTAMEAAKFRPVEDVARRSRPPRCHRRADRARAVEAESIAADRRAPAHLDCAPCRRLCRARCARSPAPRPTRGDRSGRVAEHLRGTSLPTA